MTAGGPTEHAETLAAEVLVALRRLGTERVHFALVMPATLSAGSWFGSPVTVVALPVVALCSRTLRGTGFVIPTEQVAGWRAAGKVCPECTTMAQAALVLSIHRQAERGR